MRRWILRIGVAAAGLGLIALVVRALLPQPVLVDTAPVTRGPFLSTLEYTARTRVEERYAMTAPVAGALTRSALHPGDPVKVGQVVAEILPLASAPLDPRARSEAEARAEAASDARRQALARAGTAEEALAQARRELDRTVKLRAGGAATVQEVELAESGVRREERALSMARFAAQVAAHELESARAVLAPQGHTAAGAPSMTVTSPVDGIALRIPQAQAGPVAAGTPLVEVADLHALEVVAEVQSRDAVELRPTMRVVIDHWGGRRSLSGGVRVIEPSAFTKVSPLGVEEQRVNVIVDLNEPLEQRVGLGDGYDVQARFVLWEGDGVLQVPASAAFRREQGWAVFAAVDGKARERRVAIGHRNPTSVEITEGLSERDAVILHPPETLRDGAAVRAR